jgi:lipoate-protein ligase A
VSGWDLRRQRGDADGFHQRDLPAGDARELWWFEVERPTLVLGSTQRDDVVDPAAVEATGVEVVRRRSGGAAVLLVPGETTWIDLVIPRHDPLWDDDVGRATHWVGETWQATLATLGVREAAVHLGGLERRPWSDLVCFAGLGPGEVTVRAAKVVGVAQRRTRAGARFQCALVHRWDPVAIAGLLALPPGRRAALVADLGSAAIGLEVDPADAVDALQRSLAAR